ncbi:MAG: riboflavin synthase [Polaribacter sp.]|nr:riboflavin synthase [Polaribacter sp.]MDG1811277.1 riboflavin synthase [Polaribacter sp.]
MFTGIIESLGEVVEIVKEKDNLHVTMKCDFAAALQVDQSVAHNGVCLTVVAINNEKYTVTAIKETLDKTTIGQLSVGDTVNLERAMKLGDRLDGHIVQGHVDETAICSNILAQNGSTIFTFKYSTSSSNLTIEKGSITINGVSLTVVNSKDYEFSVAIIPFTKEHTTFYQLKENDQVNLEFDVLGKYVVKLNGMGN